MWKSCRFPHPRVDNLWNSTSHQPWNDRYATRIAWPEPARLAQHPPRPFETYFLRQRRRAGLRTRDEVERGADAEQSGSVELIKTARRKQFLTRSAERDEAELRTGGPDAVDREVGLAGIRIEICIRSIVTRDFQSPKSFDPSMKMGSPLFCASWQTGSTRSAPVVRVIRVPKRRLNTTMGKPSAVTKRARR